MSYTILLIDDNRDFLRELSECLDEYNVVCAENGSQALAILRHPNEIDLVIVDQVLPDHKGTEVIKMIKKINPELEFILLTGYGSKEIAIDALRAKVDEYLEKPVQPERIKKTMAEMLARKTRGRARISGRRLSQAPVVKASFGMERPVISFPAKAARTWKGFRFSIPWPTRSRKRAPTRP